MHLLTSRKSYDLNSAVAVAARQGSQASFGTTVSLAVASATLAVIGAFVSRRVPGWLLSAAFASLMVLVAIHTVIHAILTG